MKHLPLLVPLSKYLFNGLLRTVTFDQSQKNQFSDNGKIKACSLPPPPPTSQNQLRDIETDVISLHIVPEVVKQKKKLQQWCSHLHHSQYWIAKKKHIDYQACHIDFDIFKPIQLRLDGSAVRRLINLFGKLIHFVDTRLTL